MIHIKTADRFVWKKGVVLITKTRKVRTTHKKIIDIYYLGNDTPQREHLTFVSKLRPRKWLSVGRTLITEWTHKRQIRPSGKQA
jgi:hypothetical protein